MSWGAIQIGTILVDYGQSGWNLYGSGDGAFGKQRSGEYHSGRAADQYNH